MGKRRSYLVGPPCPSSCPCRTASRETPIADLVYGMGANSLRSLEEQRADERSLSEQFIAAFDALAAQNRAERAKRVGGSVSIEGGGLSIRPATTGAEQSVSQNPPSDLDSHNPAPRKKRRTKAEMQEFRADKARQIADSYHSLVPAETRAWLDEPDPLLEQILEGQRESDT